MFSFFRKRNPDSAHFNFDWGPVTPELYSKEKNEAVHVFNFSFLTQESRQLAKQFVIGRVVWYKKHLPQNCAQSIQLDLRGQEEIKFELEMQDAWREEVLKTIRQSVPGIQIEMMIMI